MMDENLPPKLAQILNIAFTGHHQFETMHDLGLNSMPDTEWIEHAARLDPRPVVLTSDIRLRGRIPERDAIRASGLTVFMLRGTSKRSFHETAWMMIRVIPSLAKSAIESPANVFDVRIEQMNIRRKTHGQEPGHAQ